MYTFFLRSIIWEIIITTYQQQSYKSTLNLYFNRGKEMVICKLHKNIITVISVYYRENKTISRGNLKIGCQEHCFHQTKDEFSNKGLMGRPKISCCFITVIIAKIWKKKKLIKISTDKENFWPADSKTVAYFCRFQTATWYSSFKTFSG